MSSVSEAITAAQKYVTSLQADVKANLNAAAAAVSSTPKAPFFQLPAVPAAPTVPSVTFTVPDSNINVDMPALPKAPDIVLPDVDSMFASVMAEVTSTMPTVPDITMPAPPTAPTPTMPAPPGTSSYTPPTMTGIAAMPAMPAPVTIGNMPSAPRLVMPTWSAREPDGMPDSPSLNFAFVEQQYQSLALDTLKTALLEDLINGGYGINTSDETRLWSRERARTEQENARARESARREFSGRSFSLPPGALYRALEAANQNAQNTAAQSSRDVAIKRSELYVQNRQFTISQLKEVENFLLNYHGFMMERALNVAREVTNAAIKTYELKAARVNAQIEKYKTVAQVFGLQIEAQGKLIETYTAELQAVKTKAEVDMTRFEVARLQLDYIKSQQEYNKSQLEVAKHRVEVDTLRTEQYRAQVDAVVAQTKIAEINLAVYEAKIRGEQAKVAAAGERVKAYQAKVEAAKARAGILESRVQAALGAQQVVVDNFRSAVAATEASAQVKLSAGQLKLAGINLQAEGLRAKASVALQSGQLQQAAYSAQQQAIAQQAQVALGQAQMYSTYSTNMQGQKISALEGVAKIYADLLQGAMGSAGSLAAEISTK